MTQNTIRTCNVSLRCASYLRAFLIILFAAAGTLTGAETGRPDISEKNQDPVQLLQELNQLEAEIKKFNEMLEDTRDTHYELENALEANEKDISEILNKIQQIQSDLAVGEDKLSSLERQQKKLNIKKSEQQVLIARQIRASFELGNQQYLKVVLNQEDPNQLARLLKYYDYFNQARLEQIESFELILTRIEEVEAQTEIQNLALTDQRIRLHEQRSGLLVVQAQKQVVLAELILEIQRTGTAIEQRIADRKRLETLLVRIIAGSDNLPAPDSALPFANMRGNLLLPVAGRISHRFGSGRSHGKLTWDGIFIEADEGEPVQSIHYGRVVFSDWLRGFGLLLIINHGDGYMSLYAHNQVLYRETGEWVATGELIANVGNSGGQLDFGLYFEIRTAGKPSDPQLWCQARPASRNSA